VRRLHTKHTMASKSIILSLLLIALTYLPFIQALPQPSDDASATGEPAWPPVLPQCRASAVVATYTKTLTTVITTTSLSTSYSSHTCAVVTSTTTGGTYNCPIYPPPGGCGPVPMCILLKSTTVSIGCPTPTDPCCPVTRTVYTEKNPCKTCQTGCGTSWTTATVAC